MVSDIIVQTAFFFSVEWDICHLSNPQLFLTFLCNKARDGLGSCPILGDQCYPRSLDHLWNCGASFFFFFSSGCFFVCLFLICCFCFFCFVFVFFNFNFGSLSEPACFHCVLFLSYLNNENLHAGFKRQNTTFQWEEYIHPNYVLH